MKKLLFGLITGTALILSACNEDDEIIPASDYVTPDFNMTVESVVTTDANIEDVIESASYEVDLFSGTSGAIDETSAVALEESDLKAGVREWFRDRYRLGKAPDVRVDWNEGKFPRTITVDYGEKTELVNGRIISGIIEIVVSERMMTEGATRTVTFTDFSVDSLVINGAIVKEVVSIDEGRVVSIDRDLVVTLPDGTEVEYLAELERSWNQGINTPFYHGDDEMEISGFARCVDSDGNEYRRVITQPLRKKGGCRFIVSGKVVFSANGLAFAGINYGDGTCDNKGVIRTAKGQKQFIIGKRVREGVINALQN